MLDLDFKGYLNHISIDCVVFGFHDNDLRVLLVKMKNTGMYALPGGFVSADMDIDEAAVQVLQRRTGLRDIYLHQFKTFGRAGRTDSVYHDKLITAGVISEEARDFFEQRFISIGYYALVEYAEVDTPRLDDISDMINWYPVLDLPELMIDHEEILISAYQGLKRDIQHLPIGINLLPEEFTMPELQALYETILGHKLDRRNFRRKMLGYNILIDTGRKRTGGPHKAPIIYTFNKVNYYQYLKDGFKVGWS